MRYIVFSFDASEGQVFADILEADSKAAAEELLLTKRPYAVLDQAVASVRAKEYLDELTKELHCQEADLEINHLED